MAKGAGRGQDKSGKRKAQPSSTTSLGKRRRRDQSRSPGRGQQHQQQDQVKRTPSAGADRASLGSTMSNPKSDEYGSQATPLRVPVHAKDLVKVAILGAGGGIGQPLALMMMLHTEYIHHLALHDLVDSIHGVGLDLSHCDRQMKVTTHCGPDQMAEAVKGARVIVIPAGLAQRPGMSRDDLFGSNAKIMYNIAKCCAQNAPDAQLAIISNPVNSLVPLTCEVYARLVGSGKCQPKSPGAAQAQATAAAAAAAAGAVASASANPNAVTADSPRLAGGQAATTTEQRAAAADELKSNKSVDSSRAGNTLTPPLTPPQQTGPAPPPPPQQCQFEDCFRRIFGVTTLDVVRASTLTAKSTFFKNEPNGLFKDPGKISMPVVGGHAGKTIMPLLSQCHPKLDKKRLLHERTTTLTLIESIQQAGIEVLNAKKGRGSATLAMAYSACRFTLSLLRAQAGEQNVVECAYVRHATPPYADMEYFATPLLLGKDGYVKSVASYLGAGPGSGTGTGAVGPAGSAASSSSSSSPQISVSQSSGGGGGGGGLGKLLPFEQQMLEEGSRELRLSIVKGEDFAREQLSSDTL